MWPSTWQLEQGPGAGGAGDQDFGSLTHLWTACETSMKMQAAGL